MNFENKIKAAYKFAFIRHPVTWYQSAWRYMESIQWKNFIKNENQSRFFLKYDTWHPFEKLYDAKSSNVNEFIKNLIDEMPGFYTHLIYAYTGINSINYIGKQENLIDDLKNVLTHLGINNDELYFEPEKVNKSTVSVPQLEQGITDKILESEYPIISKYYS
jgi:hypothetical protein